MIGNKNIQSIEKTSRVTKPSHHIAHHKVPDLNIVTGIRGIARFSRISNSRAQLYRMLDKEFNGMWVSEELY